MRYLTVVLLAGAALWAQDTCRDCHSGLDGELRAPSTKFADDVHKERGFSCASCHGGDPKEADPGLSMSAARGFRGRIAKTDVPGLCARCHSDAGLMHRFNPKQRVDQLAQYRTSVHGRRLAQGDTAVASCVDCHGAHDIRDVRHPLSPVHPLRLPETCARCHSDREHMARYGLATDQYDDYRQSVHWKALADRQDLSAPSCASCHGNHGATPPEVTSVAAVCGSCHVLMERLYNASPHQPVFEAMGVAGCITCHGNHKVVHPTTGLLAGEGAICATCHEPDSAGGKTAVEMAGRIRELEERLGRSEGILRTARQSGMEVSEAALRLAVGRENLIKARVAVHAFEAGAVQEPVSAGLAIADEAYRAGEEALRELNVRRVGLGVSLLAILAVMAGLWLAIRGLENRAQPRRAR